MTKGDNYLLNSGFNSKCNVSLSNRNRIFENLNVNEIFSKILFEVVFAVLSFWFNFECVTLDYVLYVFIFI